MVGVDQCREVTPDGPEPNVWVSCELMSAFVAAAAAIKGVMGVASDA